MKERKERKIFKKTRVKRAVIFTISLFIRLSFFPPFERAVEKYDTGKKMKEGVLTRKDEAWSEKGARTPL